LPFGCQKSFKPAFNTDNTQGFTGKELVFTPLILTVGVNAAIHELLLLVIGKAS
jgi:hypothetical protein